MLELIACLFVIALGFFILVKSAEGAIRHLVRLSHLIGVSQFTISFIFVGFVSSLPELSIAINSALRGTPSLGLGVMFSSNAADLSLVIGMVALVAGGIRMGRPMQKDALWLPIAASLPPLFLLDGELSRQDGLVLLGAYAIYLLYLRMQKSSTASRGKSIPPANIAVELLQALLFLATLMAAGWMITEAAQQLGAILAAPLMFIGALLAIGTCLPELTLAIKAAKSNHGDLGLGNIMGNVVTDSLAGIGILALVQPIRPDYPALALLDGFFVVFVMVALMLVLGKGAISRAAGAGLVVLYLVFLAIQVISEHALTARLF